MIKCLLLGIALLLPLSPMAVQAMSPEEEKPIKISKFPWGNCPAGQIFIYDACYHKKAAKKVVKKKKAVAKKRKKARKKLMQDVAALKVQAEAQPDNRPLQTQLVKRLFAAVELEYRDFLHRLALSRMKQIKKGARFNYRSFERALKKWRTGKDAIRKLYLRKNKEWSLCALVREGDFSRQLIVFVDTTPPSSFSDVEVEDKFRSMTERFRKHALRAYHVNRVPPDKIGVAPGGPGAWCLKAARTYIKKSAP